STALTHTLTMGATDASTGGEVSQLQWFLYQQKYLDPYALSGTFDNNTRNAVITFQTKNHLLDPSNPNPAQVGVVGAQTRDVINTLSRANVTPDATAAVPTLFSTMGQGVREIVKAFILGVYINLFPALRSLFVIMVTCTLALVIIRTAGLVGLLIYRRKYPPQEVPEGVNLGGVSILIPAYNEQENIAATVESVIASTYYPREIIVIDDGSVDNTAKEVQSVIAAHPTQNIRLISVQNGGKARALNLGTEAAQYELIVVLDADAVLDKDAVGYFVPHFLDPEVAAVA